MLLGVDLQQWTSQVWSQCFLQYYAILNLQLKLRLLKHARDGKETSFMLVLIIWLSARNPHKTHGVCSTNLPPCFSAPMTMFPFLLSRLSHFGICATVRRRNREQRWPWETTVRAFYEPSFLINVAFLVYNFCLFLVYIYIYIKL